MAMVPPYNEPNSAGIPHGVRESVANVPPGDIAALQALLESRDDIAAVIVIADGAGTEYLQAVRDLTTAHGVLLIFDEVVTGFRYAPGGAQEYYGVTPDLTTLAKILAGRPERRGDRRAQGYPRALPAERRHELGTPRTCAPPRHL